VSLGTPVISESPVGPLRYIDVILIIVAAPILLLIGVPVSGYAAGGGVWLALRVVGMAMESYAKAMTDPRRELTLRLAFTMARIFALAITVILVRKNAGQDAGLTALAVVVVAFTINFFLSFGDRPKSK
jgi:hypothetical protein